MKNNEKALRTNEKHQNQQAWLWFVTVILFALVYRLIFINAPVASYDTWFMYLAKNYQLTGPLDLSIHIFRLGMIIPIRLFEVIFGYSIYTYYIIAFFFSIMLVAIIFMLCYHLFNLRIAVIASLVFACSIFSLENGTVLLTDTPCALYAFSSILLFHLAINSTGKKKGFFLFFSALAGFLMYLTKMQNIVFLGCIPVYEFLTTRKIKSSFAFALVFISFFLVECAYYFYRLGDPFVSFTLTSENLADWIYNYENRPLSIFNYLIRVPSALSVSWSGKLALIFGSAGITIGLLKKDRNMCYVFTGGLFFFLVNSYLPISINPLIPAQPYRTRYFLIFQIVLFIGLAYFMEWLWKKAKEFQYKDLLFGSSVGLIMLVQTAELPDSIGNLLFEDNAYLVADQLLEEYLVSHKINEPVYTFPFWDFWLYPSFKNLELRSFNPGEISSTFEPGIYLFPKIRLLRESTYYARLRGDFDAINNNILFLMNNKDGWDYLIDTQFIRMVNIPSISLSCNETTNFPARLDDFEINADTYTDKENELSIILNSGQDFKLRYPLWADGLTEGDSNGAAPLVKDRLYQFSLDYELQKELQGASLIWTEYNEYGQTQGLKWGLHKEPGHQTIQINIVPLVESSTFSFTLRLVNPEGSNQVVIHHVSLSYCQ